MREWRVLLGPFMIWAAHFLLVYGIASIDDLGDPGQSSTWRNIGSGLSLFCLAALILVMMRIRVRAENSALAQQIGVAGGSIASVAVIWQSLPLMISG